MRISHSRAELAPALACLAAALWSLPGSWIRAACACPPPPEVLAQAAAEGRLEELAAAERAARARGVNAVEPPRLLPRAGVLAGGPTRFRQAVVILVEFSDNQANETAHPPSYYQNLLFSLGSWPTGSMRDFYRENSYDDFDVTGAVTVWLTMPQTYAWYVDGQYGWGDYPQNAQRMVEDAVAAADPLVDFSLFDNDGPDGVPHSGDDDGRVDALFVVHAGPEGAGGGGGAIWSHAWRTSYEVPVDGVTAWGYSMEPEDGTIGVFCHEFGHVLGVPDLYDSDYDAYGLGRWSVMAYGVHVNGGRTPTHFDAWCKMRLGFVTPVTPSLYLFGETIRPAETHPVSYRLWTDGAAGDEYFLAEYRRRQDFDAGMPGQGLLIYHVDESAPDNDEQRCGSGTPHCKVALEQADGECELEAHSSIWDPGDPYPGSGGGQNPNQNFRPATSPSSRAYDGSDTKVEVRNIAFHDSVMTADFIVSGAFSAVAGGGGSGVPGLWLAAPHPNPFVPSRAGPAGIAWSLPAEAAARLAVFDVAGRLVRTLAEGHEAAGVHRLAWDGRDAAGRDLPAGAYFARLEACDRTFQEKLLLAR